MTQLNVEFVLAYVAVDSLDDLEVFHGDVSNYLNLHVSLLRGGDCGIEDTRDILLDQAQGGC